MKSTYQSVLTIAGTDSGGGAGIPADIKSISACGAYAACVITATTAQNTQGVTDIHAIPIDHLEKQLDAVFSDIEFGCVKIGMLHSCEVIKAVSNKLDEYLIRNIVLDPVMVATSGDKLITDEAIDCLKSFLPKATLITPNLDEAIILLGKPINQDNFEVAAKEIGQLYKTSVLLKGGHLQTTAKGMIDVLYQYPIDETHSILNTHIDTNNTHGTGCSLSSSIATFLCMDHDLKSAVIQGCEYIHQAMLEGQHMVLGKGNGPINHFGIG